MGAFLCAHQAPIFFFSPFLISLVKSPSNLTVTSDGPSMGVYMCVWGPDQPYDLIKLNNLLHMCECACVWGLFRYLTQLPLPLHPHPKGYCENKGWKGYSSGCGCTVFNILTHCIKRWSGIFIIFSFFTLWRLDCLLEELVLFSQFLLIFKEEQYSSRFQNISKKKWPHRLYLPFKAAIFLQPLVP